MLSGGDPRGWKALSNLSGETSYNAWWVRHPSISLWMTRPSPDKSSNNRVSWRRSTAKKKKTHSFNLAVKHGCGTIYWLGCLASLKLHWIDSTSTKTCIFMDKGFTLQQDDEPNQTQIKAVQEQLEDQKVPTALNVSWPEPLWIFYKGNWRLWKPSVEDPRKSWTIVRSCWDSMCFLPEFKQFRDSAFL